MSNHILLPACYLPPVSYFHVIKQHDLPLFLGKKNIIQSRHTETERVS
ncbi:hypothetical protein HMPREF0765_4309 [Sphingobacterium spiritivorum ATCC 33300]|uniref:Uncharacterized protein n=1 Tax=Sphingobacterium spiritivorum ATCC 33300 TaxID=525372 RepID=C2G403_SPHSI|nr:hypothetical protein HMPREF0765_4309 [Sphingobacterium spiritivorum ATCC 33300]